MTFQTSPLGNNVLTGSGGNVTSKVSNHYGPRSVGGEKGSLPSSGLYREIVVNFDATGPVYSAVYVPATSVVTDVRGVGLSGSISTATVGATDISAARDDDDSTWVTISADGALAVTGPTAGQVIVRYRHIA